MMSHDTHTLDAIVAGHRALFCSHEIHDTVVVVVVVDTCNVAWNHDHDHTIMLVHTHLAASFLHILVMAAAVSRRCPFLATAS
jgi:hypothetical protein